MNDIIQVSDVIEGYVSGFPQGTAAYVGPGDIISTWVAWWGLRAFKNSMIGIFNAIRLRRDGDNAVT